jgi:hypothetical protein
VRLPAPIFEGDIIYDSDLPEHTPGLLAKMAPKALDALSPEERHRLYRMLRLRAAANPDQSLEVSGALETEFVQSEFVQPKMVSRRQMDPLMGVPKEKDTR